MFIHSVKNDPSFDSYVKNGDHIFSSTNKAMSREQFDEIKAWCVDEFGPEHVYVWFGEFFVTNTDESYCWFVFKQPDHALRFKLVW